MKSFIKYIFATAFGVVSGAAIVICSIIFITIALFSFSNKKELVIDDTPYILKIKLDGEIIENYEMSNFNLGSFSKKFSKYNKMGLYQIIQALDHAKDDPNIAGIYLNIRHFKPGWATAKSIRDALVNFKTSKKPIYSYSEVISEKNYYLLSVADEVFMNELGAFELNGISIGSSFYKNLFTKLNVVPEVFRVGKFKAAVEPFILDKMSPENQKQRRELIDDLWDEFLSGITSQRELDTKEIDYVTDEHKISNSKDALAFKFIDKVTAESLVHNEILKGDKDEGKDKVLKFKSLIKYINEVNKGTSVNEIISELNDSDTEEKDDTPGNNKIAVIFAEGNIILGRAKQGQIGSDDIVEAIRKIKDNKNIKGVIIRVNSGGGSALASDIIWSELELLKKKMPLYASFGDIAASGGYYISAGAKKIFTQPNTITGSIGVFGLLFDTHEFFNKHIGVTFDRSVTHKYSDIGDSSRSITPPERAIIQKDVEKTYDRFISIVQKGRSQSEQNIRAIAEGRVWSGIKALEIKLVDEIGGLDVAIQDMKRLLKLKNLEVELYPRRNSLESFVFAFENLKYQILGSDLSFLMDSNSNSRKEKIWAYSNLR
jgi:protease-4